MTKQADAANAAAQSVRPQISEIFKDVFEHDGPLSQHTSRKDIARWDSLQHVALVSAIESSFNISLTMDEMMEIDSVSDIHRVLERHGV